MLASNRISEAKRARQRAKRKLRAALARLHKHHERKKQGLTVFHFLLDPVRVEYRLVLPPTLEHDIATLERILTDVLCDRLEG